MTAIVIQLTAAASLALAACSGPSTAQIAALNAGRAAIAGCQERFHEQSRTYADCVRYVAQSRPVGDDDALLAEWRALGALQSGWVAADRVGQQGDEEAEDGAQMLSIEAANMQDRVQIDDAKLCRLMQMDCATLSNRRKDLLRRSTTKTAT